MTRKIEKAMCDACDQGMNWKQSNTEVVTDNNVSTVYLHGNKIAELGEDYLTVFDGGWQTNVTKSRLNALIDRFCNALTDGVFQKDWTWYVSDNNVTSEFTGEYTFA